MSRTPLTTAQVLMLSPDEASSKAAKGLLSPAKWPTLGATDDAVWGECQGSGSKPYQTQVDVSGGGTSFKCSCPSRKFPCKHGLALLLLQAQDASRFTAPQPAWVSEWLASRRERTEKKEAKAEAAQAAKATPVDPATAAKAAEQAEKRELKRWQRMQAGAAELGLWLNDVLRQGLASLSADGSNHQAMAARMVDAQAPGLGQRLTDAMALVGQGTHWPERLLAQLGSLQLLVDAVQRIDTLPEALQADVRQAAGWPIDKETVLADGEAVSDAWQVCGVMALERESTSSQRLTERRTWFHSPRLQRHALVLDFAFAGQGFAQSWHTGQQVAATLRFYPGTASTRALVEPDSGTPVPGAEALLAPTQAAPAAWHALACCMAANPWSPTWPLQLAHARLCPPTGAHAGWSLLTADERVVPLAVADADAWLWMAHAGADTMAVFGEWDGHALHPLSAWYANGQWMATTWVDAAAPRDPASTATTAANQDGPLLLQAALVGTSRPWGLPPVHTPDAVAHWLRQAHGSADPEAPGQLLRLAGSLAWCRRAGWVAPAQTESTPTPSQPTPESRRPASTDWARLWSQAQAMELPRLQAEVLRGMNQQQLHASPEALPALLQLGRQSVALREFIQPVLGERGRWLASFNNDWAWGRGVQEQADADTQWEHGSIEQRRAVLLAERQTAPDAARERLHSVWGQLPARDRHSLITTLAEGLNPGDEAFLTQQLQKDRAQDVRRTAADLLAALPDSAYSQRMVERLRPLVVVEAVAAATGLKSLLKKTAAALGAGPALPVTLHIDAPPEPPAPPDEAAASGTAAAAQGSTPTPADDPFKTDWPDGERPRHESLGQRAWLLFQMVRRSPLGWWTQHTGLTPAELLAATHKSDWTEALVRGWAHAALTQHAPDWHLALLAHPRIARWGDATALQARLSTEQREQHLLNQWDASVGTGTDSRTTFTALAELLRTSGLAAHATWGDAVASRMASVLHRHCANGHLVKDMQQDYGLRQHITDLACALPPGALDALATLPRVDDTSPSLSERLHTLHAIVAVRQTLHRLLAQPHPADTSAASPASLPDSHSSGTTAPGATPTVSVS
ncbi:MAG: DUF5691 domain-containing protein [Hydrogenophaga sp.]|nr:DUF5691 domain-containing protein [Hydrogenophaga sp.]